MAAALAGPLQLMSESLRRAGEVAMKPEEERQKRDQEKEAEKVLAEQQRQKDELAATKRDKEIKDMTAAQIAEKKKDAASKLGRSETLLGVLNPAANTSQGRVKTLLGE